MRTQISNLYERIAGLRGRVRMLFIAHGLSQTLVLFLTVMGLSILFDYLMCTLFGTRFGTKERMIILVIGLGVLGWSVYRYIYLPFTVTFTEDDLIMCIEKEYPELNDHLITSVQLDKNWEEEKQFNSPVLMQAVIDTIQQRVKTINFKQVAKKGSIILSLILLLTVGLGYTAFGYKSPDSLLIGVKRYFLFSEKWPVDTEVIIILKGSNNVIPVGDESFKFKPNQTIQMSLLADELTFERETEEWRLQLRESTGQNTSDPFKNDIDLINNIWMKVSIDKLINVPKIMADKIKNQQNVIIQIPESAIRGKGGFSKVPGAKENNIDWQYLVESKKKATVTFNATIMVAGPMRAKKWKILKGTTYRMKVLTRRKSKDTPPTYAHIYLPGEGTFSSDLHVATLKSNDNFPGYFDDPASEPIESDRKFYIQSGDSEALDKLSAYEIEVVEEKPKVDVIVIKYTLPEYLYEKDEARPTKDTSGTSLSILKYSNVNITANFNKPVNRAIVRFRDLGQSTPVPIEMKITTTGSKSVAKCAFKLNGDVETRIELDDTDGFRNKGDYGMIRVKATADIPPTATLLTNLGSVYTTGARVPLFANLKDENSLRLFQVRAKTPLHAPNATSEGDSEVEKPKAGAKEEAKKDEEPKAAPADEIDEVTAILTDSIQTYPPSFHKRRDMVTKVWNLEKYEIQFVNPKTKAIERREVSVRPGDSITFWLEAHDFCNESRELTKYDTFSFKVVSPTEYDVEFAQRFKHVVAKVHQTRRECSELSTHVSELLNALELAKTMVTVEQHGKINAMPEKISDASKTLKTGVFGMRELLSELFINYSDKTAMENDDLIAILYLLSTKDYPDTQKLEENESNVEMFAGSYLAENYKTKGKGLADWNHELWSIHDYELKKYAVDAARETASVFATLRALDAKIAMATEKKSKDLATLTEERKALYGDANESLTKLYHALNDAIQELDKVLGRITFTTKLVELNERLMIIRKIEEEKIKKPIQEINKKP